MQSYTLLLIISLWNWYLTGHQRRLLNIIHLSL